MAFIVCLVYAGYEYKVEPQVAFDSRTCCQMVRGHRHIHKSEYFTLESFGRGFKKIYTCDLIFRILILKFWGGTLV